MTSPTPEQVAEQVVKTWWLGDRDGRALAEKDYESLVQHVATVLLAQRQKDRQEVWEEAAKIVDSRKEPASTRSNEWSCRVY